MVPARIYQSVWGEIYLLEPLTPHASQRPADTLGLILESVRQPGDLDAYHWYCEACNHLLFEKSDQIEVMERDMPLVFDAYYSEADNQECGECRHVNPK